jgi:nitrous oxide reductase accessory protein NosL
MTMMNILRTTLIAALLIAACFHVSVVGSEAKPIKCTECGMILDINSKFTSKIVQGKTTLYFCDIGDLFSYMKRKGLNDVDSQVKDYTTGEWIDAKKASYVHAENKFMTPMGWGIAAFKDKINAGEFGSLMDFKTTISTFK